MSELENAVNESLVYTCGRCDMFYYDYKQLLEHLYWRHGTESLWCNQCALKRWQYAAHVCNVLPIDESLLNNYTGPIYCFCGKEEYDSLMIGCDSPDCNLQWYHFKCVGIVTPPVGEWYCPECCKLYSLQKEQDFPNIINISSSCIDQMDLEFTSVDDKIIFLKYTSFDLLR
ncbi:unnamed protein product [Leptidea sinapis]|uniref:PHD-type domain-containing protein n=1 Tax=Leptidea sinapis TaxID=189913 RepID=A0A5E4PQL0_9NEOP|nr:unnamed protein product [Leptidea sinapis]